MRPIILFLLFSINAFAAPSPEYMRKRMLADLDFIKSSFEVKYAPSHWKKEHAHFDIDQVYGEAKAKVNALGRPTIKEYQIILKDLFHSAKDYHVGVEFYSTEVATLPFIVRGVNHRFFIVDVDKEKIPESVMTVGDEIIQFNGKPIDQVISELKQKEIGKNTAETDQALAELYLTMRAGFLGHVVPSGEALIEVKRKNGDLITVGMNWDYQKERVPDPSKPKSLDCGVPFLQSETAVNINEFFNKQMVAANFLPLDKSARRKQSGHDVGARKSFIPILGKKLWENDSDKFNFAYIFEINDPAFLPNDKKSIRVGYVRIPHYGADSEEAAEFETLIAAFQNKTDALVIDQINNPGGSIFYLYALCSMLTDKPIYAPKHRIALTQEEVQMAIFLLSVMEEVNSDETAKCVFGETLGGYYVDYQFVEATRAFCKFLISEWEEGKTFSNPIHLFGVDAIRPHPKVRYTKPILVLINSLDFSAGDFFPAILQDNKRATLLGTRTAGAGGYVFGVQYPNLIGVNYFKLTGSWALRDNQTPIENLGVTPDVYVELTEKDFQENYRTYAESVMRNICKLF